MKFKHRGDKWFKDRVGKKVFRRPQDCPCMTCYEVAKKGLVLMDKDHAQYVSDYSIEMGIQYYDRKPKP